MSEEKELVNAIGTLQDLIVSQTKTRENRNLKWIYTLVLLVTFIFGGFALIIRKVDQVEKNKTSIEEKVNIKDFNVAVRALNYNFTLYPLHRTPYIIKELPEPKLNR